MTGHPPEPTGDACNAHTPVTWTDQHGNACRGFAIWYPQMGGYGGKAVVEVAAPSDGDDDPCFEAWVWHDGEFPFHEEAERARSPVQLHHCSPAQFIRFGQEVAEMIRKAPR